MSDGHDGGSLSMGEDSSGATRDEMIDSSVDGIVNGEGCGGIEGGCGGKDWGVGRALRGAPLSGSTDFR